MLSTSAPAAQFHTAPAQASFPLPYYLAFAAGGRANGQYDAILPDVLPVSANTATLKADEPPTPSSTPIDIPLKDGDGVHDVGARSKSLSYDASTALKEHDSHMHDTLHPTTPVKQLAAAAAVPLPPAHDESSSFGQDSYFVYSHPGAAVHCVGVADGVGGWRSQGVDSGVISRAMMDKCRQQAASWDSSSSSSQAVNSAGKNNRTPSTTHTPTLAPPALALSPPSSPLAGETAFPFSLPARLMSDAYESIKDEGIVKAGSTTACVLTLTAQRCMPLHEALEPATRDNSSTATPSPYFSTPTSPPSSPVLSASSAEERHQLSLDDEHKSEEKDSAAADALMSQPAADDVDVPLSGAASDSDDEAGHDSMDDTMDNVQPADRGVPAATSASLPRKSVSAFWSAVGAVGQLIDPTHSTAQTAATTSTTHAPASPAPAAFSPPPSRPPSPSSPPLYLSCASIGDSGFVLLRHGRVLHRSDLQRTGRIVKQLAVIPPHLQGPVHRFCDDRPADSALSCHRVQSGDLLIVASDGLLDNLSAAGAGSGGRQVGFVPWARFFLTGGTLDDDSDREAIEAQNRRLEGLVKECEIDWEGRDKGKEAAGGGGGCAVEGAAAEGFVRLVVDRLVREAGQFMMTMDGKPDDVTVLVAQVCHL